MILVHKQLSLSLRPCPICEEKEFQRIEVSHGEQKYSLSLCKSCQHEFINPLPLTPKEIYQYYEQTQEDETNLYMEDPSRVPDFLVNQRILRQWTKTGKKLLDFGCGKGQFCELALQSGFDAYGFDVAEQLVHLGQEWGLPLHTGELDPFLFKHGPFDMIHSDQVFEHLIDPLDILLQLNTALKTEGILCISVPLRQSFLHEYRFIEHLSYFSENSLVTLLKRGGFKILQIRKGLPFLRRYYRFFGKIPSPRWIHFFEKTTQHLGIYGWSIVIFAQKVGE